MNSDWTGDRFSAREEENLVQFYLDQFPERVGVKVVYRDYSDSEFSVWQVVDDVGRADRDGKWHVVNPDF